MRQSAAGGAASTRSTAGVKLRPPALTHTARRPPNSGTVWGSSTSRSGSSASASPSMRASAKGSRGSSTAPATSASMRSRTRPVSGPYTRMTGRAGSGRATNRSTSAFLTATIGGRSGAGDEERGEPRLDVVGDLLRRAILGVAQPAVAGEALGLARNVVAHPREGLGAEHRRAGLDLQERAARVEGVILGIRTAAGNVDGQRLARSIDLDVEAIVRRRGGPPAGKAEQQLVAYRDSDPRQRSAVGRGDLADVDGRHVGGDARRGRQLGVAVHRLEAPRECRSGGADDGETQRKHPSERA